MALGTCAEQQRAEDIKDSRKALCDAQQAFQRTLRMWGLVLVPVTAVTAVIAASATPVPLQNPTLKPSAAAASMGIYYPALQFPDDEEPTRSNVESCRGWL